MRCNLNRRDLRKLELAVLELEAEYGPEPGAPGAPSGTIDLAARRAEVLAKRRSERRDQP